jgi:ubiquinone/menaquinone biosynthesis C-methylase UbiE
MAATHTNHKALEQYRDRANVYDLELAAFEPIRRSAIAQLNLAPGDTVIDVGCGTGLSFTHLQQAIGPLGHIIGIEQCPEMLNRARTRVTQNGWTNVTLLNASAEDAAIPCAAHAALFHFTHDILRNPAAISNVLRNLKPGAHVVATGLQWASPWAWPTNGFVLLAALRSVTCMEGLSQPWSLLAEQVGEMEVRSTLFGGVYIACGTVSPRPATEFQRTKTRQGHRKTPH